MVFFTLSKKVTGLIGPFLLRTGLAARNALSRTSTTSRRVDAPYLDMLCLVPMAQKLISLAVYDESLKVVSSYHHNSSGRVGQALDSTYDALFGKSKQDAQKEKASISELRVQVLDDQLRPALIPNDRWEDVLQWRWNNRLIKWARKEFLVSKYGPQVKEALDAYPQLRASPQLSRHPTHHMLMNLARGRMDLGLTNNDTQKKKTMLLPSSETLIKAFGMRQWAQQKDSKRLRQATVVPIVERLGGNFVELEGGNKYAERIPSDTDLYDTRMEDLLEVVTGGHVVHCGPFNSVCEEAEMYQMWTQEYVQHLGDYLLDRCRSNNNETTTETIIVDIGAGDGLLMHFLKEYIMNEHNNNSSGNKKRRKQPPKRNNPALVLPTLIATDDGSWGIFAKAEVEKLNAQATLAKYGVGNDVDGDGDNTNRQQQLIVLCSWMPMGQDWSAMFRSAGVDEYILIGEADDGTCGHNWETWGNPDFFFSEDDDAVVPPSPPYQVDGYQRWDMDVLSQFQFSRFDSAVSRSCKTVSFRKKKKKMNKR